MALLGELLQQAGARARRTRHLAGAAWGEASVS